LTPRPGEPHVNMREGFNSPPVSFYFSGEMRLEMARGVSNGLHNLLRTAIMNLMAIFVRVPLTLAVESFVVDGWDCVALFWYV
jgi:hypothetical protein